MGHTWKYSLREGPRAENSGDVFLTASAPGVEVVVVVLVVVVVVVVVVATSVILNIGCLQLIQVIAIIIIKHYVFTGILKLIHI